ncbi:Crp/Fnr family transcriptional regulator [Marinobacter daepoensis]|uniref:Crp/Fnr family transcriptional regulator n=1 Tax=Marinobacter daepoensis TaxID=262077 RepID=A0ABS3BF27_9GAMM|nr:Crp/Fnr family transcriptional regulator [Marinobacter daepoensis]MBN7770439.1 Crp/Fnr family transcriptional regulator [Marinobacter daepoensis]MBY6033971.1 Crp/Fnr family transcriptional regulator [Marinobacter daepoensis]MBY6079885.1 Crp/Fnr family transcriptional regulator [Marinobacter daepoensis]
MSIPDVRAVMRSCLLLDGFPEAAFREVAAMTRIRRFRAGDPIYDRGSMQSTLCVIASGTVRITSVNAAGREATLIIFNAGSWFGDTVFSPGMPRVFGVTAHEEVVILELPGEGFRQLMAKYPESYPRALDLVSRRLWSAMSIIEDDALRGVVARIGRRLLFLADIQGAHSGGAVTIRLTREQLANMMGMTRQGVHARIRELETMGFVTLDYGRITLSSPEALEAYIRTLD